MYQIAVTGLTGKMGQAIVTALATHPDLALVEYTAANDEFDVLIDFTAPAALPKHLEHCLKISRPIVVGTTGLTAREQHELQAAGQHIAIVYAPNMSKGVNVCYQLLAMCAKMLGADWQVAISETHHKHKKDAPSGTALKMGEVISKNSDITPAMLQFNSIRAGDVVGEHTVSFIADGERIEIKHLATNRQAFAQGAIQAAKWLLQTAPIPGVYSMQDVVNG